MGGFNGFLADPRRPDRGFYWRLSLEKRRVKSDARQRPTHCSLVCSVAADRSRRTFASVATVLSSFYLSARTHTSIFLSPVCTACRFRRLSSVRADETRSFYLRALTHLLVDDRRDGADAPLPFGCASAHFVCTRQFPLYSCMRDGAARA